MTEASNTDPMTIPTDGRIDLDALAELANRLRKTAERCKEAADGETLVGRDTARMAQYRLDEAADAIDLARRAAIPSEQGEAVGVDFMALAAHLAKTNAGRPTIERESDGVVFVSRDVAIEAMQSLLSASPSPPALDGAGRDGWRLIADDPPPTDGNSFLCGWWNADHTYWWTCKAHWANGAIDGGWDGAREPIEVHPTHWQPLPAPPKETP